MWEMGRIPRLLHPLDGPGLRDFNLIDLNASIFIDCSDCAIRDEESMVFRYHISVE